MSSSRSNLIPLAVEQSTGAWGKAARVALKGSLPAWATHHCLAMQVPFPRTRAAQRLVARIFPVTSSGQVRIPV